MDNIIQIIKDEFEDLKNISSILKQKSEFDTPYSFEKIEEWEKANSVKIPEMYKSWLLDDRNQNGKHYDKYANKHVYEDYWKGLFE